MVTIYKSFEDFSKDYPDLNRIADKMDSNPIYLLTVSVEPIPVYYSKFFHVLEYLAPEKATIDFLRKNKNSSMEILEPYIQYDVDSHTKNVGFEMIKLMNCLAPVIIVFNEIQFPYLKYVAEVLKLSLPDTNLRLDFDYSSEDVSDLEEDDIFIDD